MQTVLHRAKNIADEDHLLEELATPKQVFLCSGFSKVEVEQVMEIKMLEEETVNEVAVIPYL